MTALLRERYELVIGLEVHVHLKTRTKVFCDCPTDFGAPPNANTCPVCLGLPGALPVLNGHAVELAARAALALGCQVHERSVFARKNYFYPDLPKGYQISQFELPIATWGQIQLTASDVQHAPKIGITRVHMEEDAGKSVHDRFGGVTAIDLNRAGVPLVEIVSEPDLRSSKDARAYLERLKEILEYTEVSDANMEEGSLRVDANVSARLHGAATLGTKTEIKNMNSFSAVEKAIDAEFARHCAVLDAGGTVVQQTMLWDADQGVCRPARGKEGSHDYRYFPDPDLPPLLLQRSWIARQQLALPELPESRRQRLIEKYSLSAADVAVLTGTRPLADFYEAVAAASNDARAAAYWVMGDVLAYLNDSSTSLGQLRTTPLQLARLLSMVADGTVSRNAAKKVFLTMARTGDTADVVAEREGLLQVSDNVQLEEWVEQVWTENPIEAARLAAGESKLLGVLVGLVMKVSGGRADPKKVNQLLRTRISA
jgi:aspartyl-tRNA(Asn)/glutamyl-tRNA(Gln) amidotransferase subunit B